MDSYILERLNKCYKKFSDEFEKLNSQKGKINNIEGNDFSDIVSSGQSEWARMEKLKGYMGEISKIIQENDSNHAGDFLFKNCKELMS